MWTAVKLVIGAVVLLFVYKCSQVLVAGGGPDQPVVAAATPATSTARCSPSAFAVSGAKFRREHGQLIATASLKNNGAVACGAQLKLTTFDKAGNALNSDDFWPASVRNIAPGATEHFTHFMTNVDTAHTYDLTVIDAREWRQ